MGGLKIRVFKNISLKSYPPVWDYIIVRAYLILKESGKDYAEGEIPIILSTKVFNSVAVMDSLSDISFINPDKLGLSPQSPEYLSSRNITLKTVRGHDNMKFDLYRLKIQINPNEPPFNHDFYSLFDLPAPHQDMILGNDLRKAAGLKIIVVDRAGNIVMSQGDYTLPLLKNPNVTQKAAAAAYGTTLPQENLK